MRKGLFTAAILAGGLVFSLVGCGGNNQPVDKHTYTITIDNKQELQAEWLSDGASRNINLTITKDGKEENATAAVNKGEITFTVSDESVVRVQGRQATPAGAGTATITANYGKASDSVEVTITQSNPHGKSAEDPLTVAEAYAICNALEANAMTTVDYYTRGVVYSAEPWSTQYDNGTFNIADSLTDTSKYVKCYRVVKADGATFDASKIGAGSEVLIKGKLQNYNGNTPEYPQGSEVVEATAAPEAQTIVATVAEALAAAKALGDNITSSNKYEITGYITSVKPGSGFYMSDTKGAVASSQDQFLVYYGSNTMPADATVNAKVKVLDQIKHYVSTSTAGVYAYETAGSSGPQQYTLLEAGDTPAEATEVTVTEALTIINALKDNANADGTYKVTGRVVSAESYYKTSTGGNLTFMIGETADAAANAQIKAFRVNMTEEESKDFTKGAKVSLTGTLQKYVKDGAVTPEILSVTAFEVLEKGDGPAETVEATVAEALTAIAALADGGYSEGEYAVTGYIVTAQSYYEKNDGTGNLTFTMGDTANAAAEAQITAFRVGMTKAESADYKVGAKVKITGKLQKYVSGGKTTPEISGATAWVVLEAAPAQTLTGVSVSPKTSTVDLQGKTAAQTVQLRAAPVPAGAELGDVTWESSDALVTVAAGLVTIPVDYVAEDADDKTVTITAKAGGFNDIATITVTNKSSGGQQQDTFVVDFTAKTASHNNYGDTWTYGDVTVSGGANNNGGWEYIKLGGKSATISGATYPGTYIKTDKAIDFAVSTVTLDLLGKCYNQESEKAVIHVESYSDAALTTKVAETTSQEVPAITTAGEKGSLTFTFATPTANLYYKIAIEITNTTNYNGVFCLEKITFASAAE